MRDKRYQGTEKGLDDLADLMLGRINSCVDDRTKKSVKIKSAIVTKVNEDGTVNVKLPDDDSDGFSRLQNQSVYELNVGDSVEILLKEGSFTNSWVIAKHGGGTKRVNLVNQGTLSVVTVNGSGSSGGSSSGSSGGGIIDEDLTAHMNNTSNPHRVTKAQVGLSEVDNVKQYSASNPPPYPVKSVNSKTGEITLTASDVGARPSTWTPTKQEIGLENVTNEKQYSVSNPPPYPVSQVNGKTGSVTLIASDVGAISSENISQSVGTSTTDIPSEQAVSNKVQEAFNEADENLTAHIEDKTNPHSVTKDQVGLGNVTNERQYSENNPPPYPVTQVNSKTGNITLTAEDVGAISKDSITQTVGTSTDKIPSEAAINNEFQRKTGGILTDTNLNTVIEAGHYFLGAGNTNIPNNCEGCIMTVGAASIAAYQMILKYEEDEYIDGSTEEAQNTGYDVDNDGVLTITGGTFAGYTGKSSLVYRVYNGTQWTRWRSIPSI